MISLQTIKGKFDANSFGQIPQLLQKGELPAISAEGDVTACSVVYSINICCQLAHFKVISLRFSDFYNSMK